MVQIQGGRGSGRDSRTDREKELQISRKCTLESRAREHTQLFSTMANISLSFFSFSSVDHPDKGKRGVRDGAANCVAIEEEAIISEIRVYISIHGLDQGKRKGPDNAPGVQNRDVVL